MAAPRFAIFWQFTARSGKERQFEEAYGPRGEWAALFRTAKGYLGSHLYRSEQGARRYLVVDRWTSREAFAEFKRASGEQYRALDVRCEELTEDEVHLGDFTEIG